MVCQIHTNGRLPLKLHTTVKEGVTNLEKKLFTISVYACGLTGLVRVKFDQMVQTSFLQEDASQRIVNRMLHPSNDLNFLIAPV